MISRRQLLAAAVATGTALGRTRIDRTRISAITDEIADTPDGAIDFCKHYGLQWVEIRGVPGPKRPYIDGPESQLRELAKQLSDNGIRVSFLDSSLLKHCLPGAPPVRREHETGQAWSRRQANGAARFEKRMDELRRCLNAAHILGCGKVRFFAFSRVPEPAKLYPRIADIVSPMAEVAGKEGVRMLIENEPSCNVGSSAELAAFLRLLPSRRVAFNWDPGNAYRLERPFPDGYSLLPKKRLANVQVKARGVIPGESEPLDWAGIFRALERDNFHGCIGLETHIFDNLIPAANASMKEIMRIVQGMRG